MHTYDTIQRTLGAV